MFPCLFSFLLSFTSGHATSTRGPLFLYHKIITGRNLYVKTLLVITTFCKHWPCLLAGVALLYTVEEIFILKPSGDKGGWKFIFNVIPISCVVISVFNDIIIDITIKSLIGYLHSNFAAFSWGVCSVVLLVSEDWIEGLVFHWKLVVLGDINWKTRWI